MADNKTARSSEEGKLTLCIIGGGKGGAAIIELFSKNEMANILDVIDIDDNATGINLAKKLGIKTARNYKKSLNNKELDLIINTTGSEEVQEELLSIKPSHAEVISGHAAKLMWSVVAGHKRSEETLQKSRDAFLNMLEDVSQSYNDLEELFTSLIKVMVNALDAKSQWTKGHSVRVSEYAVKTAAEMGFDEDEIKNIRLAGLLHDIGKIGTYDYLLDKPAKLTDAEFAIVKQHPVQGTVILKDIKQLKDIIPLIRHHHERIDGRGYPDGLKGEDIPFGARILCIADTFDAIMADRPYRPSPGIDYAAAELKKWSGAQFDPQAVEAFFRVIDKSEAFKSET